MKKRKITLEKIVTKAWDTLVTAIVLLGMVWVTASYFEITTHNQTPWERENNYHVTSYYNFFVVMANIENYI